MTKLCAMAAVVLAVLVSPAGAARTIYGEPYEAPKVAAPALLMQRALVVDGKLDEWAGIPAVFITGPHRTVLGGTKWTGNNDLSARLRLAWNTDGLLLALEVDDDVLKNPFKGTSATWQGDCVELFLDAREPAKRDGKHGKGTFQIFCTPGLTTDQKADCIYGGKLNEPAGMKVASTITATGYIIEIAIPFSLLPGVKGAEGQTIGIDVAIDDCDDEAREEQLVWAGTGNNWAETSQFATVTLVGKGLPTTFGKTLDTLFAVSLEPADKQTVSAGLFLPGWAVMVVKSASLELKPPDGKTVFAVSDIPWRADGGLYTAAAEIDVSLLDDGNYDLRIALKGKDGKVFKEITRRCQLREQGTVRVSSKEWYKVSKDQVKSRSAIYTPERMKIMRENCSNYSWAKAARDGAARAADSILKVPIAEFLNLMPSPNMVRDMSGYCPYCGWTTMGTAGGMDAVHRPWESTCPSCGKLLPGFDAKAYFLSGKDQRGWFDPAKADKSLLPKDREFRKIALQSAQSYVYQYWSRLSGTISTLARAYAFTGEKRYGRYAMQILVRFADFYPYFNPADIRSDTHPGAMIQDGWEASFMRRVALAYDMIWPLAADPDVLALAKQIATKYGLPAKKDGKEIQQHIENRIFATIAGERTDCGDVGGKLYPDCMRRIWYGNAGRMHVAPETIGIVLGDSPLGKTYMEEAEKLAFQGWREDGSNIEGAISYDLGGFNHVKNQYRDVMRLVDGYEKNHWKDDKGVEAAYNLYFDLLCLQRFYPHYGDAAICGRTDAMFSASDRGISGLHSWRQRNKTVAREYALVFDSTGIERFARIAWYLNGKTVDGLRLSLYDLGPEAIEKKIRKVVEKSNGPVERSFAAPILGMAILKSGGEGHQRALWLRGNRRNQTSEAGWHGHADSMNLGLFAHGLNLMPDLGYMDQKRWVFGHNTVSLQKGSIPKPTAGIGVHEQDPNLPKPILSEISFIAEFPGMQVVRAVGTDHPDSSRTVLLVDVDKDNFYLVDHFRVGPSVPDEFATYSFHTNQGKLTTNLEWKKSAEAIEGTTRMFGKWVPPLFDAPQDKIINPWWAEVAIEDTYGLLEDKSDVKVRFTALRASDRVSHTFYAPPKAEPVVPKRLPYLFLSLAKPEDKDEPRLFTSVIEPYRAKRPVASAAVISGRPADAEIIAVSQADGKELALLISDGKEEYPFHAGQAKADVAAITTHEGNVIGIALRGQYVRILTEAIALEAVGGKGAIASGGITFGPEREVFEFALSTPLRIILPGMFTVSVKEGAHVSDIQTAVSTMSFVLTPDPATGGRGTFTVKPK